MARCTWQSGVEPKTNEGFYRMSDFLRKYKPLPSLETLNPGIEPGWKYDVLILQAEPEDKVGNIILSDQTKNDEMLAAVEALLVSMAPNAFTDPDRPPGEPIPYQIGDRVITKKFPAGLKYRGRDGNDYMIVKDTEIIGKVLPEHPNAMR